jgi:hypothetical protein
MVEKWHIGAILGGIVLVVIGIGILFDIYPKFPDAVVLAGGIGCIVGGIAIGVIAGLNALSSTE